MHYVIQENVFSEENYEHLLAAVQRLGLSHEVVQVRPGTDEVEVQHTGRNVFVFGAIKLARVAKRRAWQPGSLLNGNHDYRVYGPKYGDHMLNADSRVMRFSDDPWAQLGPRGVLFIRPCLDNKAFAGQVFDGCAWREFNTRMLNNPGGTTLRADTPIQVAPAKRIQKEIRFWIVNGVPVTASQYRLGTSIAYSADVEEPAYDFVRARVGDFELAQAFVMDACLVGGEYKIVECGCINSAGFYRADLQRLVMAIDDAFDSGMH